MFTIDLIVVSSMPVWGSDEKIEGWHDGIRVVNRIIGRNEKNN